MSTEDCLRRLFRFYGRNAKPEMFEAYCAEFERVDVDDLDRAVTALVRDWDKVSLPPPGVIHRRLGTAERVDEGELSQAQCRALIIKRLEGTQGTSSHSAVTDSNIFAHWKQFASQLGWPRLDGMQRKTDEKPHKFDEEEVEAGRMIFDLYRHGVFWCHKQLVYAMKADVRCTGWSQEKCHSAVQPTPAETREAYEAFAKDPKPVKQRATTPTEGLAPLAETLGGMF